MLCCRDNKSHWPLMDGWGNASVRFLVPVAAQLDRRVAKKLKIKIHPRGRGGGRGTAEFRLSCPRRTPDADDCSLRLVDASALPTLPEHICDEQFASPDTVVFNVLVRVVLFFKPIKLFCEKRQPGCAVHVRHSSSCQMYRLLDRTGCAERRRVVAHAAPTRSSAGQLQYSSLLQFHAFKRQFKIYFSSELQESSF